MANHLDKDEFHVLQILAKLMQGRKLVTRKRLVTFLNGEYVPPILHAILDNLRRKEMVISARKAGVSTTTGYVVTTKGRRIVVGERPAGGRHVDTYGVCDECGLFGILSYMRKKYVCRACMLRDENPLNLEDFVYARQDSSFF